MPISTMMVLGIPIGQPEVRERLAAQLPFSEHTDCVNGKCEGCDERQSFNYLFRDGD